MRKRYIVLGLSAFLALALAVPALGGPSNPIADVSATAKKTAKKALKKAKKAQQSADAAQSDANSAGDAAAAAQTSADGAQAAANAAQATADSKLGNVQQIAGPSNPATGTNATATKVSTAICPEGTIPTGGSHAVGGDADEVTVSANGDPFYGSGWFATGQEINGQAASWSITATAYCATTTAPGA